MTGILRIKDIGPAASVQDLGRPGLLSQGLSRGGAMDRLALLEATALLGLTRPVAAIEMAGMGGSFVADVPMRFALTGATMGATIDGVTIPWNGSHHLFAGQELRIGGARDGVYGYVTFAGGFETPQVLDSQSLHGNAGIGNKLKLGDTLELGNDPDKDAADLTLKADERFSGGEIRVMPGPQTDLFSKDDLQQFGGAIFSRSHHANRQGVRLDHPDLRIQSEAASGLVSDFILAGDIQLTGEGIPFVLMSECQTIGGYPRIGTVLPDDLPKLAQAPLGASLRFNMISLKAAEAQSMPERKLLATLRGKAEPRRRDPKDILNLLSYQLISGVTRGDELDTEVGHA